MTNPSSLPSILRPLSYATMGRQNTETHNTRNMLDNRILDGSGTQRVLGQRVEYVTAKLALPTLGKFPQQNDETVFTRSRFELFGDVERTPFSHNKFRPVETKSSSQKSDKVSTIRQVRLLIQQSAGAGAGSVKEKMPYKMLVEALPKTPLPQFEILSLNIEDVDLIAEGAASFDPLDSIVKAKKNLDLGDADSAIDLMTDVINRRTDNEKNPVIIEAFYVRGLAYRKARKIDEAIIDFKTALNNQEKDLIIFIDLARSYLDNKNYGEVIKVTTKLLHLTKIYQQTNPTIKIGEIIYEAHKYRGYAYFLSGSIDDAQKDLKSASSYEAFAKVQKDHYYIFEYLGRIYFSKQEYSLANFCLTKACEIGKSKYGLCWAMRAEIEKISENYKSAEALFEKASKCKKVPLDYYLYFGKYLFDFNEFEKAKRNFDIYIHKEKNSSEAFALRAESFRRLGLSVEAHHDVEQSLKLNENDLLALECGANLYYEAGEFEKAREYIDKATQLSSDNQRLDDLKKKIYQELNKAKNDVVS
ncbi:MAG: hypothetical protein H0W88_03495 [Parachlamydiaceae bacterium]|nr:hypothetical protein [Parachlamydiaceae bacterium]